MLFFPPVLQAINFKATPAESLLFQKTGAGSCWLQCGQGWNLEGVPSADLLERQALPCLCVSHGSHQRPHGLRPKGCFSRVKRCSADYRSTYPYIPPSNFPVCSFTLTFASALFSLALEISCGYPSGRMCRGVGSCLHTQDS